ncbi:hypothetical protein F66182_8526 [Fusarium sp. NRRL 66182]|nr:hypothetical protein F66182_8526 [Fusarium sp. NRRL 66182]
MGPFLKKLQEEEARTDCIPRNTSEIRQEPDGTAIFEAALWRKADKQFKTETEIYDRLQDLQGVMIPRLYAVIHLVAAGADDMPFKEDYIGIYVILLEAIPGYTLWDLPVTTYTPVTEQEWTSIVQRAVDSTHEINKPGIILDDSAPRNIIIDKSTYRPFLIDSSPCWFRDTMSDLPSEAQEEGWDTDAEFCEIAREHDNTGAIGRPMMRRLRSKFGFNLDITYPDSDDLLHEIKSQAPGERRGL